MSDTPIPTAPLLPTSPAASASALARVEAGVLVLCDVVGFSPLSDQEQLWVIEHLWSFLGGNQPEELLNQGFDTRQDWDVHYNGTGDGVLLAFPGSEQPPRQNVLALCNALHQHMAGGRKPCQLRVAAHLGPFQLMRVQAGKYRAVQVVGSGPNVVARVASFAGPGETVVSEKFVDSWRTRDGSPVLAHFHPVANPMVVAVKHDQPLEVRVHVRGDGDPDSSPQFRKLSVVGELITSYLDDILEEVATELHAVMTGQPEQPDDEDARTAALAVALSAVEPRATLFSPLKQVTHTKPGGETHLACTNYRRHFIYDEIAFADPSRTTYQYDSQDRTLCEGPIAWAFVDNQPYVLTDLPNPADTPKYLAALSAHGIKAEAKIRGFSRRPRTWIAIPCGLPNHPPEVVVCVDIVKPLDGVSRANLEELANYLFLAYGTELAAFWRLRY